MIMANYHPLRDILSEQIDFDTRLRSDRIKLMHEIRAINFVNRLVDWGPALRRCLSTASTRRL